MDVLEIRHRNLKWLLKANKAAGHRDKDFGQRAGGIDPSYLSQLKNGKTMGEETARGIEEALGKPHGWMDNPQWESDAMPIPDGPDDLAKVVEAIGYVQGFQAQALAATIPTAAREVLQLVDFRLPEHLRETAYIQSLRAAIVRQLAHTDRASPLAVPQKSPASPQRKRR